MSARKEFSQVAVNRLGYSGAAVARFLGVTTSLVNRYASSEEVGNLGQYIKVAFAPTLYIKLEIGQTPKDEGIKIYWICYRTFWKKETSCKEIG